MRAVDQELAKVEDLLGNVRSLPTLPELVAKLNQLLSDPEAKIQDIAELVLKDHVLTAHVIRLANSSFFAKHREITNLREAIVFLGFRALRNLVLTSKLVGTFKWKNENINPRRFWEHSFAVGVVSSNIATHLGYSDVDNAYLAGLVHDLGIVLISQYLPDAMDRILAFLEAEKTSLRFAEQRVLGLDHTAFGGWLARKWHFGQELQEVMVWHHDPTPENADPELTSIVSLADMFCRSINLGYGVPEYWSTVVQVHPAWRILQSHRHQMQSIDWERFLFDLGSRAEEVRQLVKSVFEMDHMGTFA